MLTAAEPGTPEAWEQMEQALDYDFEGWQPEPGDKIMGVVITVTESSEGDYGTYPVVSIVTPTLDAVALHCFHSVLRSAIERNNPQPGDTIAIKYKGTKEGKGVGGQGYEDYNVIVHHVR
jgi:hypothetical protein